MKARTRKLVIALGIVGGVCAVGTSTSGLA
jgi:hypothetical protein